MFFLMIFDILQRKVSPKTCSPEEVPIEQMHINASLKFIDQYIGNNPSHTKTKVYVYLAPDILIHVLVPCSLLVEISR